jgi:phosphatidylserine/phosphatidylglycerophosphate/cardiolipin synthase-like enzyme
VIADLTPRIDRQIGDVIEHANRRHHVRRLKRNGWERALRGDGRGWASSDPILEGNRLEVYIDGASALPAIAAAVRGARSFVHIAGWTMNPDFGVERYPAVVSLRELLADAAARVDVRVLVWAGAPVAVMHPSRKEARQLLHHLVAGTRIHGALDAHNRPMHCHHEKLVIVDGEVAFVGGIDLTDLAGDRFDGAPHGNPARLGWHDVAASLAGPSVADVASHFVMRWEATTGERLPQTPAPAPAGQSRVQVVRTVPEKTYRALPQGDFGILEAYTGALRRARQLIYLENQFLWSAEVVAVLREKLLRPPSDDFRLCMVLPLRPNNGNDDTRGQLAVLQTADRNHRLLAGSIGPLAPQRPGVYVHAKVGVIDDQWLTVGSANLNEHSLFNDTEVNLVTDDAALARSVRERLWSEHLGQDCAGRPPLDVIETEWRPLLSSTPPRLTALRPIPAVSRRSARLLGPLKGLFVDG